MNFRPLSILGGVGIAALLFSIGCGGGSSSSSNNSGNGTNSTMGSVHVVLSDDATEDWATIGVKVLSVSLVPQGGGSPVVVYTAPSTPPVINLVQLDQLGEIIGNTKVPAGTYTAAQLTLGANNNGTSCDVSLVASGDPESGFDVAAGKPVPCNQIAIVGAQGSSPNMTVPLTVNLATPLTVTSSSTNALDLEFDLNNPALIVEHDSPSATTPILWAVNFNGPVRHHPCPDLTKLLLRHVYGQVASVSADNTSISIDKAYPVHPITSPETATVSTTALSILADATNGTLYYNLDSGSDTPATITSFATVASTLPKQYVRIAARYQQNGTLVATRIYSSATFDNVWKNPEGHVLHVNTAKNVMYVTTEDGNATEIAIGPNTNFYYKSSNTPTGTGTTFFDGTTPGGLPNLARGFKVNVTIDPLSTATPPVALAVEIDVARYGGKITLPTTTDFTYTRTFNNADNASRPAKDNYSGTIDYISSSSANTDQAGNAITGFYWWDFTYPTLPFEGTNAVTNFISATDGTTSFGGAVGSLNAVGLSNATWNDPAAGSTWAADWALLLPSAAPLGTVTTPLTGSNTFTYTVPAPAGTSAATAVTVDLSTTSGSATLVYQVDRQGNVITITPQDISNATTLATVVGKLTAGVPVKIFGVPQTNGSLQAYTLLYYTNTVSAK